MAATHGSRDLGPKWIADSEEAKSHQLLWFVQRNARRSFRHHEHAQASAGQIIRTGQQTPPSSLVERILLAVAPQPITERRKGLDCSLQAEPPLHESSVKRTGRLEGELSLARRVQLIVEVRAPNAFRYRDIRGMR
jgi:hypothetical protein